MRQWRTGGETQAAENVPSVRASVGRRREGWAHLERKVRDGLGSGGWAKQAGEKETAPWGAPESGGSRGRVSSRDVIF